MLNQAPVTIPAENRDFPKWHHGRKTYAVWVLRAEGKAIQTKFKAAREHIERYLLEPYRRQPHIILFVCGFLVDMPQYNDDFTPEQLQAQIAIVEQAHIQPFEIVIGGLNSFASAPFLEVHDPDSGIPRLRELLARGGREFRTAPYTPHLTVGLYADVFPSEEVARRLAEFTYKPIRWTIRNITLATYKAYEFAGKLNYMQRIGFEINEPAPLRNRNG